MRNTQLLPAITLIATLSACGGGNNQLKDDAVTVDVTASYPEKELIVQDFMDVEYVPLETTDEFITRGVVKSIGKKYIVTANWGSDGDIFLFDRTGKGVRKINRQGQSGEEYTQATYITLDEANHELYISDYPARKIMVYDLQGAFKRSFSFADTSYYSFISDYDRDHLICFKGYPPAMENEQSCHILVSKHDGSVAREIEIPFKEVETPVVMKDEMVVTPNFCQMISYHDNWLLTKASSDIIYSFSPDGSTAPFLVRTPSIHSMDPKVFLCPIVITDRYYFMQALTKKFNFEKMRGFPTTDLVYDKQENSIFQYNLYNDDFTDSQVSLNQNTGSSANKEIAAFQNLEASKLIEALEAGRLKGKLKDIAAGLDEESNAVLMLIKHKTTKNF